MDTEWGNEHLRGWGARKENEKRNTRQWNDKVLNNHMFLNRLKQLVANQLNPLDAIPALQLATAHNDHTAHINDKEQHSRLLMASWRN